MPSGFHRCPVDRHWGARGAAGCLPWTVWHGRAYVLLGKRSGAVQQPGTWSCFGGAIAEGESPAQAAERECREEITGITARPGTTSHVGECAACGWQYTTFLAHVGLDRGALPRVRTGWETSQARWVRVAHVRRLNLNPGFAVAWANLRHAVEAQAAA
jgi:ADP-ribose pyrophosphatase YjhB (NUDIX family)